MSEEREGGVSETEQERVWDEEQSARERGAREAEAGEIVAGNSSPGRCGVEGIIQTLLSLSPLLHLSKRECESWQSVCACRGGARVGPLRGQGKKLWLHSSSLCAGPTAAHRHLASHWSLISTDRGEGEEEEEEENRAAEIVQIAFLRFFLLHSLYCVFSSLWLYAPSPWHCTTFKGKEKRASNAVSARTRSHCILALRDKEQMIVSVLCLASRSTRLCLQSVGRGPASLPELSAPLLAACCANQRQVGGEQPDMNADVTVTWILVWSCSEAERQSCAGQLLLRQQWRALRWW